MFLRLFKQILRPRLFGEKWFSGNHFPNFLMFICHQKNWSTKNTFQLNKNLAWFPKKYFPFILGGKHFPEVVKNLEISYYLLIITNLVLKFLIAIHFVLIFFSISPFKIWFNLIFILTLVLIFMIFKIWFLCLFAIKKIDQRKTLSSQIKIWLGFQKSIFLLFWAENTF
jgi:hypothetical protein